MALLLFLLDFLKSVFFTFRVKIHSNYFTFANFLFHIESNPKPILYEKNIQTAIISFCPSAYGVGKK